MSKNSKINFLILGILIMATIAAYRIFGLEKRVIGNNQISTQAAITEENNSQVEKNTSENQNHTDKNELVNKNKERQFGNVPVIHNDKAIPVLMYHSIDYEKGNELRVPKEKFREQMKYLKDNEYTALTFDELYSFLVNNKPVPEKSVVITFDDGYKDNYTNAYPILKEFGLNATVFVITKAIDTENAFLTSEQLKEMETKGISIQSHTLAHDELNKLSYDKQKETLKESKEFIERLLNKEAKYTAYPFGKYNSDTLKALKQTGYTMAFTTVGGWTDKNQGLYTLHRVYISGDYDINEFKRRLTNPKYNNTK